MQTPKSGTNRWFDLSALRRTNPFEKSDTIKRIERQTEIREQVRPFMEGIEKTIHALEIRLQELERRVADIEKKAI